MIRRIVSFLAAPCVLLLATYPALLPAQAASWNPGVEFSCLVWEPLSIAEVFYRDGNSYLPLEFSPGNRSQLYPLKEATSFEVYEKATGADGVATYKLVGKAPWIAGVRRMLFLIEPVPNITALPFRIFSVNDALDGECKDSSVKVRTRHWSAALAADGA